MNARTSRIWPVVEMNSNAVALTARVCFSRIAVTAAGSTVGAPRDSLVDKYGRLRTVVNAPDGTLWVTTSNKDGQGTPKADDDRILRIVLGGGNGVDKS